MGPVCVDEVDRLQVSPGGSLTANKPLAIAAGFGKRMPGPLHDLLGLPRAHAMHGDFVEVPVIPAELVHDG